MMDLYDERTAQMRLNHSVIRVGGLPVYVDNIEQAVRGRFQVSYHKVGARRRANTVIPWDADEIDISPVPLGLCNVAGKVYNVERRPRRQWKIGLASGNGIVKTAMMQRGPSINGFLDHTSLRDTILNKYPTLKEAKVLLGNQAAVAISRNFWVHTDGKLYHRHIPEEHVGRHAPRVKLFEKYFYLQEQLEEELR